LQLPFNPPFQQDSRGNRHTNVLQHLNLHRLQDRMLRLDTTFVITFKLRVTPLVTIGLPVLTQNPRRLLMFHLFNCPRSSIIQLSLTVRGVDLTL
jgi:hypothetical protein